MFKSFEAKQLQINRLISMRRHELERLNELQKKLANNFWERKEISRGIDEMQKSTGNTNDLDRLNQRLLECQQEEQTIQAEFEQLQQDSKALEEEYS